MKRQKKIKIQNLSLKCVKLYVHPEIELENFSYAFVCARFRRNFPMRI